MRFARDNRTPGLGRFHSGPVESLFQIPSSVAQVTITAIEEGDLASVGSFLNQNLNGQISPDTWVQSLIHPWCGARPNFGFQARDGERLVGVFCAIYSDQTIDGRRETFCNPHSWCVLNDYRSHSISLPLHVIRQRGYHFTMLTPNAKVAEIFGRLGFKTLDEAVVVFPNLPSIIAAVGAHVVCSDPDLIASHLSGQARRDFEAHRGIPWLKFLAFGEGDDVCLVVYKHDRWKRLACARIIDISDPVAFDRHMHLMRNHLLLRHGLLVSRVERRFLLRKPRIARSEQRTQPKLFLSSTLKDSQVRDLYTELVALDL
jgi:hypothetical protein